MGSSKGIPSAIPTVDLTVIQNKSSFFHFYSIPLTSSFSNSLLVFFASGSSIIEFLARNLSSFTIKLLENLFKLRFVRLWAYWNLVNFTTFRCSFSECFQRQTHFYHQHCFSFESQLERTFPIGYFSIILITHNTIETMSIQAPLQSLIFFLRAFKICFVCNLNLPVSLQMTHGQESKLHSELVEESFNRTIVKLNSIKHDC